jgi:hypothetical protein
LIFYSCFVEIKKILLQYLRFHLIKQWYEKYERILLPLMLLFGVTTDAWAFVEIDTAIVFCVLALYVCISGFIILFINRYDEKILPERNRFLRYVRLLSPLLIQFLFGALLNAVFIFYFFSGTLSVSWPFFAPCGIAHDSQRCISSSFYKTLASSECLFFSLLFLYIYNFAIFVQFFECMVFCFEYSAQYYFYFFVYIFFDEIGAFCKKTHFEFCLEYFVYLYFYKWIIFFQYYSTDSFGFA